MYSRRDVERGVREFTGWNRILKLMKVAEEMGNDRMDGKGLRDAALIAFLFAGGFRVSEVVRTKYLKEGYDVVWSGLKVVNLKFELGGTPPHLLFENVMALKGYKKLETIRQPDGSKRFITERTPLWRLFPIPLDEPIIPKIKEYLETVKGEYLFPITSTRAYQIVEAVDASIWPHWFRAQRAAQLAREYGFKLHDMLEFFQWKDMKTAVRYASMGYSALLEKLPTRQVNRIF